MDYVLTVFSAILGAGLFGFVQFLIARHDDKNDRITKIEDSLIEISKQLNEQERAQCRTQMLLLISDYPDENAEIMKIAQYYFSPKPNGLQGDWYLSNLFSKWLVKQNLGKPEWFNYKI